MARKTEPQRAIDTARGIAGGTEPITSSALSARPGVAKPPIPTNFAVASNVTLRSGGSPKALVTFSWTPALGGLITQYTIQVARNSGFTSGLATYAASGSSAAIELDAGIAFYARIRSESRSGPSDWTAAISFTAASDLTVPAALTGIVWSWGASGDLVISWDLPTDAATRVVEVKIYSSASKTTLYRTLENLSSVVWTAAMNRADTGGTPDTAVYIELRPRSWQNVYGAAQTPGTQPSLSAPAAPTSLVQSWSGDTGSAPADLVISWTGNSAASGYRVSLDGVVYATTATRFVYTLAQNTADHSGTPDPVISISITAVNGLDLASSALSGTATNAAPAAPSSVQVIAVPGAIVATVDATEPPDFKAYRYRIIQTSPSASDITIDTQAKVVQQSLSAAATYQVGVKVIDAFGQLSSEVLSSATGLDLTIETLRAEVIYSDSKSTAAATLKAALTDDVRTSGGITYGAVTSWRWIRAERALIDRYRYLTVAIANLTGGSTTWYIRTSTDGTTWQYFAGPVTSSRILTAVASEAAAQAAAVNITTLGTSAADRVELPSTVEARYIELAFRSASGSGCRVDEFYPRRLVQADDIQAQNLSSISANLGTITAGSITSVTITGSTITGGTIQTAASGARVVMDSAGLKTYDSSGTVVIEATTATNGALTAGAGAIKIDNTGIDIRDSLTSPIQLFDDATSDEIGRISASGSTGFFSIFGRSGVQLELGTNNGSVHTLTMGTISGGTALATFSESVKVTKGLNVGSATGAGTGEIRASGSGTFGGASNAAVRLLTYGSGTVAGSYAFNAKDSAGANLLYIENNGNIFIGGNTGVGGAVSAVTRLITYGSTSAAGNYAFNAKNSSGTNLMYLENNGTAFVNSAWTVSDASEKRNIRGLQAADLARARAVSFARYTRNLGDIDEVGVIAQDVQAVAPEFVREGMDGVLAVNMIALLCAKVAALEAQIAGGKP